MIILFFNKQLDVLHKEHSIIFDNNKILLEDAAYNSSILRYKAKQLNFGKMLTCKNIINSKEPIKEMNLYEKLLLKKRINVEHVINKFKQHKRCQIRYDKYIKNFNSFVYMASLKILIKNS